MVTFHVEVGHCTAIAGYYAFESPFVSKNLIQQFAASTARVTIQAVVSTHHFFYITLLNQSLEGWHVCFPQITWINGLYVESMSVPLRTTMYGIMFSTSMELVDSKVRKVTLQSIHYSQSHDGSQVGVFTVGFLATSPPRVTENVYVRSPESKTCINLIVAFLTSF